MPPDDGSGTLLNDMTLLRSA